MVKPLLGCGLSHSERPAGVRRDQVLCTVGAGVVNGLGRRTVLQSTHHRSTGFGSALA